MAIAPKFEADISADISNFMRRMATVDKKIKDLASGVVVDVNADISNFMRRAATVQATAADIENNSPTVTVSANTSSFLAEAATVQAAAADINSLDPSVNVNANTAGFLAQMATVQAATAAVASSSPTVTVDANTAVAAAQVTGFMAAMQAVTGQNLIVRIRASWANYQSVMGAMASFSRNFSEIASMVGRGLTIAISPAIVPVLASVVGLLGNLGPMLGTIAGSTFALGSAFGTAGIGAAAFGSIAVSNLKDIFGAAEDLKKLQEKLADTTDLEERAKITEQMTKVQSSLNDEQRAGLDAMNKLKSTWSDIATSFESQTIEIFTSALSIMSGVLTDLKPMFAGVMDAAEGLIGSLGKAINAKPMQDFFSYLNTTAGPMLETITTAVGNFFQGFFSMMTAFGPLATETAGSFLKMSESFAAWAAGLSESKKFQAFVDYVSENMPKIRSIFSDAIQGMINMFGGFGGSSSDMMTSLQNMMERFKNFSSTISENQGFQKFIDYIKTNGPVVVAAIGEIITLITNLGIAAAPMGEKMLSIIEAMTNFTNEMLKAHPWLGKLAVGAIVLTGAFLAALPVMVGLNALLGGFITKMILATAKTIWAATVQVAKWILMGVTATINAIKIAAAWTLATGIAMVTAVAKMIASAAIFVARWTIMGAQALVHAARVAAAWLLSTGAAMATAVAGMVATAAVFVAKWVWMGVQALIAAARMAAAWFIALGPVGWVIGAIVGLAILIIANWDKISAWTKKTWTTVSNWIKEKWSEIKAKTSEAASNMLSTVVTKFAQIVSSIREKMASAKQNISSKWEEIKSAAAAKLGQLVSTVVTFFARVVSKIREKMAEAVRVLGQKVGEMPGKVLSHVGKMISAGSDLVRGLINGIKNMAGSAIEAISGVVGGVISKAKSLLNINSPSRVFSEFGGFISEGLANGVSDKAKLAVDNVARMASAMTSAFNPQLAMADMRASAQLDTSINRADMGVVRKSFAAEIDSGEKQEQAIYVYNEFVGDKILTVVNRGQAKQSRLTDGFYGK